MAEDGWIDLDDVQRFLLPIYLASINTVTRILYLKKTSGEWVECHKIFYLENVAYCHGMSVVHTPQKSCYLPPLKHLQEFLFSLEKFNWVNGNFVNMATHVQWHHNYIIRRYVSRAHASAWATTIRIMNYELWIMNYELWSLTLGSSFLCPLLPWTLCILQAICQLYDTRFDWTSPKFMRLQVRMIVNISGSSTSFWGLRATKFHQAIRPPWLLKYHQAWKNAI